MRWFIYKDHKVYGPYEPERLAAFIAPETPVTREGGATRWVPARDDADLAPVLDGTIRPIAEWYANRRGHQRLGPMTRGELVGLLDRGDLEASDLLRHETWESEIFLGKSRFYALWRDPALDLDELSPDEVTSAPRAHRADLPTPPGDSRTSLARAWRRLSPGAWWILAGIVLLLLALLARV